MADEKKEKEEKIALVKMTRNSPAHDGGPLTANVHPDEVENYVLGGWQLAEASKAEGKKADTK